MPPQLSWLKDERFRPPGPQRGDSAAEVSWSAAGNDGARRVGDISGRVLVTGASGSWAARSRGVSRLDGSGRASTSRGDLAGPGSGGVQDDGVISRSLGRAK